MKTSLIKLSILLLLCGTASAQWIIKDEDVYSKSWNRFSFGTNVTEDSIINIATAIYVRPGYWLSPAYCKINRNGVITDSVSLYGNGIAQIPTSINWTNDGHYFVGRDTTSFRDGSGSWLSRKFEFRSTKDHHSKWFLSGVFEIPGRKNIFVDKNNAFWLEHPYKRELYSISKTNGDTLFTLGAQQMNQRWQLGNKYNFQNTWILGPTWRRSDTCLMMSNFSFTTSNGNTSSIAVMALATLDSLKVLSRPIPTADLSIGDYDRFNLDNFHFIKDSVIFKPGNKLDRVLYEEDMITGAITKTLRIKDLEYDPDTARFRPNHFYQVYNRGAFCLYIEEFEAEYPIANSRYSGYATIIRVRLYQDSTLLYSKEIADTSDGGYLDTKLADAYLFPDGEALINMRVRWATSRLLYIDAQGNHWLKEEQVDLSNPVSVYPTLVEDQIFISCPAKKLKVQLYSLGGSLVHEQSLESFNETYQIGSLKLESGIYILKGSYQNGAFTRKVIMR